MLLWLAFLVCTAVIVCAGTGLIYRAERKRLVLAWDSVGIVIVSLVNLAALDEVR